MDPLETACLAVMLAAALANGTMAVADLRRAPFVLANAAAVDVPPRWLPALGALKGAGAVGLLLGVAGVEPIGIAAALGLTLFFLGAIATHLRGAQLRPAVSRRLPAAGRGSLALAVATA